MSNLASDLETSTTDTKIDNKESLLPKAILNFFNEKDVIAIGVSGGSDSIALSHILRQFYPDKKLIAFTVDHGLRPESEAEAIKVGSLLQDIVDTHEILTWQGDKPDHGIQAAARQARHTLFAKACAKYNVDHVCLAHHSDDQAETFLHRLAKGSGLQGLCGMRTISRTRQDVTLVRPLLKASHSELITYCKIQGLDWIEDPSNQDTKFTRVRFRQSRDFLEAEGLSNQRINRLCMRLQRAHNALSDHTNNIFDSYVAIDERGARIDKSYQSLPDEMQLRLIMKAASLVSPADNLSSRLERLEALFFDQTTKKFTLSGFVITKHTDGDLTLSLEILSV